MASDSRGGHPTTPCCSGRPEFERRQRTCRAVLARYRVLDVRSRNFDVRDPLLLAPARTRNSWFGRTGRKLNYKKKNETKIPTFVNEDYSHRVSYLCIPPPFYYCKYQQYLGSVSGFLCEPSLPSLWLRLVLFSSSSSASSS